MKDMTAGKTVPGAPGKGMSGLKMLKKKARAFAAQAQPPKVSKNKPHGRMEIVRHHGPGKTNYAIGV
jgi:hypothetical protein